MNTKSAKREKREPFIRSTVKKQAEIHGDLRNFPIDEPGVIYVRQSSIMQVRRNLHSYEMQTDDFVAHFRRRGATAHIEVITDDEGKSGTLNISDRKGLSRTKRLIEGDELLPNGERVRGAAAVNVGRFTRDEWLIVPSELMRACYENDVWISTLRMDFNFQDEYCRRIFMLEADEAARHLKWMKEILGGARRVASDKGIYDGRWVMPGYIVDYREYILTERGEEKNPTYKKYIVYEPHAKVVKWLYRRLLELGGNIQELCREIDAMPYLFPPFEPWVDRKCRNKFSGRKSIIKNGEYKGYYKPSPHGIRNILQNEVYIGWWIPMNGGLVENNHSALIEDGLFVYAHKRLSTHDHAGNRVKPARNMRHGKTEVLLKEVVEGPEEACKVYPLPRKDGARYIARYYYKMTSKTYLSVKAAPIDVIFVEKFFERLQEWQRRGELDEWKRREDQESDKEDQEKKKKTIKDEIKQAEALWQEMWDNLNNPDIPKTDRMRTAYAKQMAGLETKIAEFKKKLETPPEEDNSVQLRKIWELIPTLQAEWNNLPFKTKLKVVKAFTRRVVFSIPSLGWFKMVVEWKIGEIDIMHQRRYATNSRKWSAEENQILRDLWPNGDGEEIIRSLPDRSYSGISTHAQVLGLKRETKNQGETIVTEYWNLSLMDKQYAEEHGLNVIGKNCHWSGTLAASRDRCCCC